MTSNSDLADPGPAPSQPVPLGLLASAFLVLGLLIGTLLAFSAQSLAQSVVAALFAFFGGGVVPLVAIKDRSSLGAIAASTFGLSVGALLGTYSGVYVNEHRLLSPVIEKAKNDQRIEKTSEKYLRENLLELATQIDVKRRTNLLTAEQAYDELAKICTSK